MNRILTLAAFAATLTATSAAALAGQTPAPAPMPMPSVHFPDKPLHAKLIVEVNHMGQVVRVAHGDLSGDRNFDLMTIGNAMQMWIRHPDGTAETGTYTVTYDYNPKTHNVARVPTLLKAGGDWANKPGAATLIIQDARRQQEAIDAQLRAEQMQKEKASEKNLPDINAAVRRAASSPSASPTP